MSLKLAFEIELRSDYHVSAGYGLGALVDSALHRDADGLPVLRGTTINGLLRDGLYRLLQLEPLRGHVTCQASGLLEKDEEGKANPRFCGQHDPEQEDCPICRVFGSARTAKHWWIGSARPAGLPLPVSDGWQPGQTGGQIAPHVRISPRTRRAEARKLFYREEGDSRLRFHFTAECDADNPDTLAETELLVAAARFVRNLGAARRRGRGECRIHLLDEGTEGDCLPALVEGQSYEKLLLAGFRQHWLEEKQPEGKAMPIAFTPSDAADRTPVRLRVVARADEPLLISEKAEAGNQFQTVEYIPGSALRGALAGRVAARHDLDKVDSDAYRAFVRLFFRDGVQFPTLYPAHRVSNAIYPAVLAPLDLLSCELYPGFAATETAAAHSAAGFALRDDLHPACLRCNSDLKPLGGFLSLRSGPHRLEINRLSEMHVHIHPGTHRAASGDLFGYDVLAPGQYFVGELTCADAAAWENLCALAGLPEEGGRLTLRLGKACRRGYGKITLWIERQPDGAEHPWLQLPLAQRVTDPTAPLVLTLLTDAIVPDPWGRFQTSLDADWLSQALGVKVRVKRAFCANRVVDSFNAQLGLPRWRDVALRAGSAVGLEITEAIDLPELLKHLEKVEREGLGLRRSEGFGRVAFNHPLYNGCAAVRRSEIRLPVEMRPATGSMDHGLAAETEFRRRWATHLAEQNWRPFHEPEFESLARLLRGLAPASVEEVEALLDRLGRSDELLPSKLVKEELAVRETEKEKLDFFRAGKGQAGLEALRDLVKELAREATESGRCWRIGREMLADRIAAEARKGEE
jgi:CRISPR-associated protein Csx10